MEIGQATLLASNQGRRHVHTRDKRKGELESVVARCIIEIAAAA